ncbi:hypothetical protein [Ferrimonas sp.]|uniref:hypothetical protein n=1 Tax=Ferrimonas sp. TaxID=2080861 RepID=UPI003A927510
MIEWSWRVEKGKEIYFGSWSDDSDISSKLAGLNGLIVSGVTFQARLPEIQVELSGDTWVCSFSTVEGDPEWAMITPQRTLISQKGHLRFE